MSYRQNLLLSEADLWLVDASFGAEGLGAEGLELMSLELRVFFGAQSFFFGAEGFLSLCFCFKLKCKEKAYYLSNTSQHNDKGNFLSKTLAHESDLSPQKNYKDNPEEDRYDPAKVLSSLLSV